MLFAAVTVVVVAVVVFLVAVVVVADVAVVVVVVVVADVAVVTGVVASVVAVERPQNQIKEKPIVGPTL